MRCARQARKKMMRHASRKRCCDGGAGGFTTAKTTRRWQSPARFPTRKQCPPRRRHHPSCRDGRKRHQRCPEDATDWPAWTTPELVRRRELMRYAGVHDIRNLSDPRPRRILFVIDNGTRTKDLPLAVNVGAASAQ